MVRPHWRAHQAVENRNSRLRSQIMKTLCIAILAALFGLSGCATPVADSTAASAPAKSVARSYRPSIAQVQASDSMSVQRKLQSLPEASQPPSKPIEEPDAVVMLDPASGSNSADMDTRLGQIAAELARDERILVRLESHVPGGGSSALDLGLADKALHKVKERLQTLGVPLRRILLASFGGEHATERDSHQHWVELYLIRPAYSALQPSTGKPKQ